jgi:allantoinase
MDADQLDLKITGHVVTPGRVLEDGWIGVRGEIVAGLGPAAPTARQVIDARGQWIPPGAVDARVHCFSEPAGGFTHATRAAAAVGVTTIIEMPYDAEAPVVAGDVLDRKKDRLHREAVVDVALLGTIRKSGGLDAVGELAAGEVCGFKASMFETDPSRFPRIAHGELIELFRLAAAAGLPVGLRADLDLLSREEPVPANPGVGSVLTGAADRTGRPYLRLPSHAANQMAKIAPIGMLFATSRDGRSHCPEKWTEELAPGLRP